MNAADRLSLEARVLVIAPTPKDGGLTRAILARAGITSVDCGDLAQMCEHLTAGAGAVLIAEEAAHGGNGCLAEWLGRQPLWSDLPVLVLARAGADSAAVARAMEVFSNVTIVERPARVAALVSLVRSALRARRRQYQLRDELVQRERLAEQLDLAMAAADAGSWQFNPTTGEFSASDRAVALHGLPPGSHLNHERARACVHPADRASVDAALQLTLESGQPFRHEHRVQQADGTFRWVLSHARRQGQGEQTCVIGLVQDVTERKEAEHRLKASEERFRLAANAVKGIIYEYDLLTGHVERSSGLFDVVGYRPDEVPATGAWWWAQMDPDDQELGRKRFTENEGAHFVNEYRLRHKDGRWLHVEDRALLLRDASGNVVKMVGSTVDVTARKQAEAGQQEALRQIALTLDSITDGFTRFDREWRVVHVNDAAERISGRPRAETLGRTLWELAPDLAGTPLESTYRRCVADGMTIEFDHHYAPWDRWFAQRLYPTLDGGLVVYFQDITDRKRAERLQQGQRRVLELIATGSPLPDMLAAVCRLVEEHEAGLFCALLLPEHPGRQPAMAIGASLPAAVLRGLEGLRIDPPNLGANGQPMDLDGVVVSTDVAADERLSPEWRALLSGHGLRAWMSIPVASQNGAVLASFAFYRQEPGDHELANTQLVQMATSLAGIAIQRHRAEQVLRTSEHRLRLTLEAAMTGLWDWDVATNIVTWSRECYLIHGVNEGEFDGSAAAFDRLLHPDDRSRVWATVRAAVDKQTKYECEFRIVRPDGQTRWVSNTGRAMYVDGQPATMVGVITDITERQRADEALRDSEALSRSLMEGSADCVKVLDTDGRLLHINGSGLSSMEIDDFGPLYGQEWSVLWPANVRQHALRAVTTARGGQDHAFQAFRPTAQGTPRWWDVVVSPVRDTRDGPVARLLSVSRDITAQKQAEIELLTGEQRMRLATEATGVGIWQWNVLTGDIRWDASMFRIYGVPATDNGIVQYSTWRDAVLPADLPGQEAALQETMRNRGSGRREFRIFRASDGACRVLRAAETVRTNDEGRIEWILGTNLDVTEGEQAEEELRRLATALQEADRRKDEFLATLAHELRNPLAPMRNGLHLMRLAGVNGTVEQARAMMDRQLTQLVRLVDDLMDVSRVTSGKLALRRERVALKTVIDAAVETSQPVIEHAGHALTVVVPDEPILIDADAARLAQVVSNLLNNSAKYTHRGGHIRLTAWHEGGKAVVAVKDNGIGIPPHMLGRVFDMFTQMDRALEKTTGGLGIGLSLVRGVLDLHGGTIEARSDGEGMGSEFVVRLPAVMAASAGPGPWSEQTHEVVPSTRRRILVVDDNTDAANSLCELLQMLGNDVCVAHDGETAIATAASFRPDIVLLDIGMPKLNGYEAATRIRQHPWGRSVVLVALTGWGHEDDRERSAHAGFDHHFVKPLDLNKLMKLM